MYYYFNLHSMETDTIFFFSKISNKLILHNIWKNSIINFYVVEPRLFGEHNCGARWITRKMEGGGGVTLFNGLLRAIKSFSEGIQSKLRIYSEKPYKSYAFVSKQKNVF
jgi:hypothetical protein